MVKSLAAFALALAAPSLALAQGVQIEHQAVGCLVAGKYPVLNACFTPGDELARARVYFKAENSPHWYYVDMKPATPCFTGTLPRPKKEIGGLSYYVEATDKAFNAARTDETATRVVGNASECRKDVPVAPFVDKATVLVGAAPGAPIVPLGFAAGGGLGAAGTAAVIGAGAAAAGGAAAAASGNGNSTTTTTFIPGTTSPSTTQPPPTTAPTTTVPTTVTPANNLPPTLDVEYGPSSGQSPLLVRFNLCGSRDPESDPLRFTFDFENDGEIDVAGGGGSCRAEHTYTGGAGSRFNARLCVGDRIAGHDDVCRTVRVDLSSQCLPGDTSGPSVDWLEPQGQSGLVVSSFDQLLKVDASDPSGVAYVDFYADFGCGAAAQGSGTRASCAPPSNGFVGRDTTGPPFSVVWNAPSSCSCYGLMAVAVDNCGNSTDESNFFCIFDGCSQATGNVAEVTWVSEFSVPGASAQLVLNGSDAFFPGNGRGSGRAALKGGSHRLEGQLVAAGRPGTWRLELSGENALVPGSIKVLAGDALDVSATSVTFRMQGRAGERVVIGFRTK